MIIPKGVTAVRRPAWPLVSALPAMSALVTVPAIARAHLGVTVTNWRLGTLADAGEVVISELASNAVRASTGRDGGLVYVNGHMPLVRLRLFSDGSRLLIECIDQAPGFPVICEVSPDAESGRGLMMVAALTGGRWG